MVNAHRLPVYIDQKLAALSPRIVELMAEPCSCHETMARPNIDYEKKICNHKIGCHLCCQHRESGILFTYLYLFFYFQKEDHTVNVVKLTWFKGGT